MPCIAMHPKRKGKREREMCMKNVCFYTTCIGKYINKTIKFAKFIHLLCDQLHCSRMRAAHYHVHTLPHNCYFVLFISFIERNVHSSIDILHRNNKPFVKSTEILLVSGLFHLNLMSCIYGFFCGLLLFYRIVKSLN